MPLGDHLCPTTDYLRMRLRSRSISRVPHCVRPIRPILAPETAPEALFALLRPAPGSYKCSLLHFGQSFGRSSEPAVVAFEPSADAGLAVQVKLVPV